jgi:hypothetical protein
MTLRVSNALVQAGYRMVKGRSIGLAGLLLQRNSQAGRPPHFSARERVLASSKRSLFSLSSSTSSYFVLVSSRDKGWGERTDWPFIFRIAWETGGNYLGERRGEEEGKQVGSEGEDPVDSTESLVG